MEDNIRLFYKSQHSILYKLLSEHMNDLNENIENKTPDSYQYKTLSIDINIESIELGDVILIHADRNQNIDKQTYYVYYIDEIKLKLLNTSNHQLLQLNIDGYVADESITSIDLLSRSEVPGFAKQHKLLPPQWIDIHFNGEVPVIVSGEITNLEEDMIEVTTYPGMRVIYIDFGYKGMPESLPIEKIVLRDKPKSIDTSLRSMLQGTSEITREELEQEPSIEIDQDDGQTILNIPDDVVAIPPPGEIIEEFLQDTEVGDDDDDGELEALNMFFEIRESDRRYKEEIQVADLLGELVSKLPVEKRTPNAMKDIHRFVTRFKELRRFFSVLDENDDVVMPKVTSILHKPIIDHIVNLDRDIKWLLPVTYECNELVSFTTKRSQDVYDGATTHIETDISDIVKTAVNAEKQFMQTTNSDLNKYDTMMKTMDTVFSPFSGVVEEDADVAIYLRGLETKTDTELLVSNDDKYQMDVSVQSSGTSHYTKKNQYTVRRYTVASSRQVLDENIRKRVYNQTPIGPADRANIRSIIMLPRPVLMQSQSVTPSANIYLKSKLTEIPIYKFRILRKGKLISNREIDDVNKELEYEDAITSLAKETGDEPEKKSGEQFLRVPVHYFIGNEESNPPTEETFRQFLNAVIPRTRTLIRWLRPSIKNLYSFADIVSALEIFLVESENITFKQYVEIRYYIKEKIRQYIADVSKKRKSFMYIKSLRTKSKIPVNRIQTIFKEEPDFDTYLQTMYAEKNKKKSYVKGLDDSIQLTSSETLNHILQVDGGDAYGTLINLFLVDVLIIPESVVTLLKPPNIESEDSKLSANKSNCGRRYIAKKYRSISELRKDDNNTEVFYDKEYDDTPYHLLDKYKDEKKRFREEEDFREFFVETLIQKHDCPPNMAELLANTIMSKKKRVNNGEYAILEIKPTMASKLREDVSSEENEEIEREAETRKYAEFYRRNNNKWELDNTVGIESFIDTNTLFCELSESCNKISDVNQCVPTEMAALQMRLSKRARMIEEFETRVARTFEEVNKELQAAMSIKRIKISRNYILNKSKLYRQSMYNYNLGKYAKSTDNIIQSPHIDLRDRILGWPDFVSKQNMIYTFCQKLCRQPNPFMQEEDHWMYCIDTNSKLFPKSLQILSEAFIKGEYSTTLDILLRDVGQLSDDGDAIVDKYTGYTLRKIDFSSEEGFDESGFRLSTNAIVEEKDIGTLVLETLQKKEKLFENPTAKSIYNVFHVLSENMGIQKDMVETSIEEFVLRVSLEMISDKDIVMEESPYNDLLELEASGQTKKKKPRMPYTTYYNQFLIHIVGCVTFVAMQTLIPTFKTKKTFPGCVKSFDGYPLDSNVDNTPGLKYIACVLDKSKYASSLPWSAIELLSVELLLKRMKTIMQSYTYPRPDIQKLYEMKRNYLISYPDNDIPDEIAIQRWIHFLPPVVNFSIETNSVKGISDEYEKELFNAILQGSPEQLKSIGIIKGKLLKHGYFIYDIINTIVNKKKLLLLSGSAPFLENACCNEDGSKTNPIEYFQQERPDLTQVLQKANKMEQVMLRVKELTKSKMFFDPKSSRILGASIPNTIISKTIYETFIHFCNFDNDVAIPSELLTLTATKPEYNRFSSIEEKIAFMKKHGKNYGVEDFHSIMRIVNSRNMVHLIPDKDIDELAGFKDMLSYFDDKDSSLVELRLRELLRHTLEDYDPKVALHEERANNRKLNKYLKHANSAMHDAIISFIETRAGLRLNELDKLSDFLEETSNWKFGDDMATVAKEIYNMIYNIAKVYPNKTLANNFKSYIPKHWGFSIAHQSYLQNATMSFYNDIIAFSGDNLNSTFSKYLNTVVANLTDLVLFVEQIPVFSPIIRNGVKFWNLYSDETVLLLYKYVFLSTVHEYVTIANDREFIQLTAEPREQEYEFSEDEYEDYGVANQIKEFHIVESDSASLKETAAKWLSVILKRELDTKTVFNRNYNEIIDSTMAFKYKDKKDITDYLAGLSRDVRRVEQELKKHKIGRWNVGKELYKYNKGTYNKETSQWHTEDKNRSDAIEEALTGLAEGEEHDDIEDLERMERIQQSEDYDNGDGWDNLNEEYMDGVYYEEDAEQEDYNDGY